MSGDNKIAAFWEWFFEHRSRLESKDIDRDLIAQLEERLFLIKRLDWEIGPGVNLPHQFSLSPRGDVQTLQITKEIVAQAPLMADWEFFAAKPPKKWNLVFDLMIEGASYEFDGKLWEFVAYKFKDGTYDLVFKPDSTKDLLQKYLYWAGTIIVDGEIGEEESLTKVGKIEITPTWNEKSIKSVRRLEVGLLAQVIK
jgi:hypothetical protein